LKRIFLTQDCASCFWIIPDFYSCFFFFIYLFQPISTAAKLLKGKSRKVGDSAESHHQAGSRGTDKATDASNRTAHYGVPQVPAKTPIINALPLSNQRKQPSVGSSNFYQTSANVSTFNRQGQSQRFSVPSATHGRSHPSKVNSRRLSQHSDANRHLLQVSHIPLFLCMQAILFSSPLN